MQHTLTLTLSSLDRVNLVNARKALCQEFRNIGVDYVHYDIPAVREGYFSFPNTGEVRKGVLHREKLLITFSSENLLGNVNIDKLPMTVKMEVDKITSIKPPRPIKEKSAKTTVKKKEKPIKTFRVIFPDGVEKTFRGFNKQECANFIRGKYYPSYKRIPEHLKWREVSSDVSSPSI